MYRREVRVRCATLFSLQSSYEFTTKKRDSPVENGTNGQPMYSILSETEFTSI